jgi:hypothetical protein
MEDNYYDFTKKPTVKRSKTDDSKVLVIFLLMGVLSVSISLNVMQSREVYLLSKQVQSKHETIMGLAKLYKSK